MLWPKHFGKTTALIAVILLAVTRGTVTMASLIQIGAMTNALNTHSLEKSAAALGTQQLVNAHSHTAIIDLQQLDFLK